ncbi:MAG: hypothetical protein ACLTCP_07880 [Ruminococcus bicirculans (ex Wegman et al. 2014)]
MADERWYVHNDDIYGVSIDHDPEFGSGRSDPYYEWCDITDIDELKKQKEMLWEKIRCIESGIIVYGCGLFLNDIGTGLCDVFIICGIVRRIGIHKGKSHI